MAAEVAVVLVRILTVRRLLQQQPFPLQKTVPSIGNIDAQDADGDTLSYTLSGVDADLFSIDTNGDISFNSAPDYENPTDEGNDNSYTFEVSVNDGITSSEETVTVTVTAM